MSDLDKLVYEDGLHRYTLEECGSSITIIELAKPDSWGSVTVYCGESVTALFRALAAYVSPEDRAKVAKMELP
jgi:hypothetical protein